MRVCVVLYSYIFSCPRFGQTMKHAGVAVSVTTFTDVIAFFVGTNTLLPGLQSFCVYAAVSIFTIYAMQVTHFVAWFSLGKYKYYWLSMKNFVSFDFEPFWKLEKEELGLSNLSFSFIQKSCKQKQKTISFLNQQTFQK